MNEKLMTAFAIVARGPPVLYVLPIHVFAVPALDSGHLIVSHAVNAMLGII